MRGFQGCCVAVEEMAARLAADVTRIDCSYREGVSNPDDLIAAAVVACFVHADRIEIHEREVFVCERCLNAHYAPAIALDGFTLCAGCASEITESRAYRRLMAQAWREFQMEDER